METCTVYVSREGFRVNSLEGVEPGVIYCKTKMFKLSDGQVFSAPGAALSGLHWRLRAVLSVKMLAKGIDFPASILQGILYENLDILVEMLEERQALLKEARDGNREDYEVHVFGRRLLCST